MAPPAYVDLEEGGNPEDPRSGSALLYSTGDEGGSSFRNDEAANYNNDDEDNYGPPPPTPGKGGGMLRVIVRKATGLPSKGSYVIVKTGGESEVTGVERRSHDVEWNDEMHFYGELHEFVGGNAAAQQEKDGGGGEQDRSSGLTLTLYDTKGKRVKGASGGTPNEKKDMVIGSCHVSLRELTEKNKWYRVYELPLQPRGGIIHFSVSFNASTRGLQEAKQELKTLSDNISVASEGLKMPGRVLLEGFKRASKQHFTNWVEEHVAKALEAMYTRSVKWLHDKSEVPSCIAATLVAIFDRMWVEVREPVTGYLKEEFSRAIGAAADPPVEPPNEGKMRAVPPPLCVPCYYVVYLGRKLRIHLVRTMYPHDKSLWRTVKNPHYIFMFILAIFPYYGVAAIFWVITFFFIERSDTFQMCQYICSFKGFMAFTTGIVGLCSGGLRAALAEDGLVTCVAQGTSGLTPEARLQACQMGFLGLPGGWATFWWDMGWWVAEVLTVWASFVLLPYSNDHVVAVKYVCSRAACSHHTPAASAASAAASSSSHADDIYDDTDPHGPSPTRLFEAWDQDEARMARCRRKYSVCPGSPTSARRRRGSKDRKMSVAPPSASSAASTPGYGALATYRSPPPSPPPSPPSPPDPLANAFDHSISSPPSLPGLQAELQPGLLPFRPRRAQASVAQSPMKPLEWAKASQRNSQRRRSSAGLITPLSAEPPLPAEGGGRCCPPDCTDCGRRCCDEGGCCSRCKEVPECVTRCHPLGCVSSARVALGCERIRYNRRQGGVLRRWFGYELSISSFCGFLVAIQAFRLLYRVGPDEVREYDLLGAYAKLTLHEDMQFRAACFWVRVIYGLLSLPFFIFTIPYVFEALTRSRATAYDENGNCVRMLTPSERVAKARDQGAKLVAATSKEHMSRKSCREHVERLGEKYSPRDTESGTPRSVIHAAADLEGASNNQNKRDGSLVLV